MRMESRLSYSSDRLLAIVVELQRKGLLRAEDLAGTYEVSVRTIYRDIQAFSERDLLRSLRSAIADERKVWFCYSKGGANIGI